MQTTYRWYQLHLPDRVRPLDFADLVLAARGDGWFRRDDEVDDGLIFFRRSELWYSQSDAQGNISNQRVETIAATRFGVIPLNRSVVIRVMNPSRNMQHLMSSLERAFGVGFAAQPIILDDWAERHIIYMADVSRLVTLKVINVAVRSDCVARMEFASKEGMGMEPIPMLRNTAHKIESLKYELIYRGVRGYFSASSGGLVKIGGSLSPFILGALEKDVLKICARNR